MRRRLRPFVAIALVLALPARLNAASSVPACQPRVATVTRTQDPVDALLALPRSTALLLLGQRLGRPRFLGHGSLLLVRTHPFRVRARIALPAYTVPPGLAELDGGKGVAVVLDNYVLLVDPTSGRIVHRWALDMQAVGWPAAVAASGTRLFVAGQPVSSAVPAARLETLELGGNRGVHAVVWQTSLGLTHAGIWLGMVGPHALATYLPDSHDLSGSIATWDTRTGALLASYGAPGPALAADPNLRRLYGSAGTLVYARTLERRGAIVEQSGTEPMAADSGRNLLLFARGGQLVAASARTLLTIGTARLTGARALAVEEGGSTLLVGLSTGLVSISLASCRAT